MTLHKWVIFILGFVLAIVPGQASISYYSGDSAAGSTLATAISNWNTASGLTYLSDDSTFTGTVSGTPATYFDATTNLLFTGYAATGSGTNVDNGSKNSLSDSGTTLVESSTPAIIEITGFAANTDDFAFELKTTYAAQGYFCIGFNETSFTGSSTCDTPLAIDGNSATGFIGIASSTPITSIWIGPENGQQTNISLLNFYAPADTPEASSMLLLGGGLILLGLLRRRRLAAEQA